MKIFLLSLLLLASASCAAESNYPSGQKQTWLFSGASESMIITILGVPTDVEMFFDQGVARIHYYYGECVPKVRCYVIRFKDTDFRGPVADSFGPVHY